MGSNSTALGKLKESIYVTKNRKVVNYGDIFPRVSGKRAFCLQRRILPEIIKEANSKSSFKRHTLYNIYFSKYLFKLFLKVTFLS